MDAIKRVLVVEDDPHIMDLMLDFCEEIGVEGIPAMDGEEALRLALSENPDAITMDHRLPDTNGLAVVAKLKASPITRHIPILYVSSDAKRREAEALSCGAVGVVPKPVTAQCLEKGLQTCWKIR